MKNQKAEELYKRYLNGTCSAEEKVFIEKWYLTENDNRKNDILNINHEQVEKKLWNAVSQSTRQKHTKIVRWPQIAAAAAILIVIGGGLFFFTYKKDISSNQLSQQTNDIPAGGNKAYLTLTNGKRIVLTDATSGVLAKQEGIQIMKAADGQLIYTVSNHSKQVSGALSYNTIETPKGGQIQVHLSDGTIVWLNAASKLKYPISFASLKERKVQLTGEAYFVVKHDAGQPFRVQTSRQMVEDIGTEFNINAYPDEASTKTTLIEGSAKVFSLNRATEMEPAVVLKPGQQSLLVTNGNIKIADANINEAIAWKNGLFSFKNADLKTVMRQIARWYDVEVVYKGEVPGGRFTGEVYRNLTAANVLEGLSFTGVKFKIEGRKVIVSK